MNGRATAGAAHPGYPPLHRLADAIGAALGGRAGAPLVFESGLLGFILLLDASPGRFTERDAERLTAFAGPAALALHAALVFESE